MASHEKTTWYNTNVWFITPIYRNDKDGKEIKGREFPKDNQLKSTTVSGDETIFFLCWRHFCILGVLLLLSIGIWLVVNFALPLPHSSLLIPAVRRISSSNGAYISVPKDFQLLPVFQYFFIFAARWCIKTVMEKFSSILRPHNDFQSPMWNAILWFMRKDILQETLHRKYPRLTASEFKSWERYRLIHRLLHTAESWEFPAASLLPSGRTG